MIGLPFFHNVIEAFINKCDYCLYRKASPDEGEGV